MVDRVGPGMEGWTGFRCDAVVLLEGENALCEPFLMTEDGSPRECPAAASTDAARPGAKVVKTKRTRDGQVPAGDDGVVRGVREA